MVGKMSMGLDLEVLEKSLNNYRTRGDYYYSLFSFTFFLFDMCEVL
jgi:hypothetical protein